MNRLWCLGHVCMCVCVGGGGVGRGVHKVVEGVGYGKALFRGCGSFLVIRIFI